VVQKSILLGSENVLEHRYKQYCALARALEVAGERWTLLIVRELIPGPRRFSDLIDGLPEISRNLLTQRLRRLERDGIVVRSDLPPPAARQVYELSDDGRDLAAALGPLIGWGARRLGDRRTGEVFSPRWAAVAMASLADREAAIGVKETYQFLIDDMAFHFKVDDGSIEPHDGKAENPAVTWTTDEETWAGIAAGKITAPSAVAAGALKVTGDRQAAKRLRRIFSPAPTLAHG
jgi:DNA-binding HxlR family transcriptional regulator/putative sterol carrier protein